MTYAAERAIMGREILFVAEIDAPICSLTYGISPCTATGSAGDECYNTRKTCQDSANFTKTTQTIKLCSDVVNFPKGQGMVPCIIGEPEFTPTKLTPGKGIGPRGTVRFRVKNFPWPDRDLDPYWDTRSYKANIMTRGTYWGRMLARHPYIEGSLLRVRSGYLGSGYDVNNFKTRLYVVNRIDGPDESGFYTIFGKDPLSLVTDDRAKIPIANTGTLSADITSGATTCTLNSGEGADYSASGHGSIGDEVVSFTRSSDTFTITRAQYGTDASAHSAGDVFQECYIINNANICDLLYDMLTTFGGVDGETYIPYDAGHTTPTGTNQQWDDQYDAWLSNYNLNGIIAKPKGLYSEIQNVLISCNVDLFWDEVEQEYRLISNMPPIGNAIPDTLNSDDHFVGRVTEMARPDLRVSDSYVWFNRLNPLVDDRIENYPGADINIDEDSKGTNKYNQEQIRQVFARYFDDTNAPQAAATAARYLNRFSETPKEYIFKVDARHDDYAVGDLIYIQGQDTEDPSGAVESRLVQIIEIKEVNTGHLYRYRALTSQFKSRYAYIGPATLNDYPTESESNKMKYAFISPDTHIFTSDGAGAYLII